MEVQGTILLRFCTKCGRKTLQVEVTEGDLSYLEGKKICHYCPQCGKAWEQKEIDQEV